MKHWRGPDPDYPGLECKASQAKTVIFIKQFNKEFSNHISILNFTSTQRLWQQESDDSLPLGK